VTINSTLEEACNPNLWRIFCTDPFLRCVQNDRVGSASLLALSVNVWRIFFTDPFFFNIYAIHNRKHGAWTVTRISSVIDTSATICMHYTFWYAYGVSVATRLAIPDAFGEFTVNGERLERIQGSKVSRCRK